MSANMLAPIFLVLCAVVLVMTLILRIKRRWAMAFWVLCLAAAAVALEITAICLWFFEFL